MEIQFHNKFSRFRGYVFFESENSSLLPWNTTKTGIDADSNLYKSIFGQMTTIARPIIDFLEDIVLEAKEDNRPLYNAINNAGLTKINDLPKLDIFKGPAAQEIKFTPPEGTIKYTRPIGKIKSVLTELGVKTQREVGEHTFDYYYDLECGAHNGSD